MGRGSDTRMYAPRSESSRMYSSANEDECEYSPTSPEDNERRAEKKKLKEEEAKKKVEEIKQNSQKHRPTIIQQNQTVKSLFRTRRHKKPGLSIAAAEQLQSWGEKPSGYPQQYRQA